MRQLSDREFIDEWLRFFGVTTGVRLLGWCALSVIGAPRGVQGDAGRRWLIEHGAGAPSTRYRNVHALLRFRDHLVSRGYDLGPLRGSDVPVMRRMYGLVKGSAE